MAKSEINPLDVAYVERDIDLGGYFVYYDADLRDRDTEPTGRIIGARAYSKLVSTYGIPTIDEFVNGRRKNPNKIRKIMTSLGIDLDKEVEQNNKVEEERDLSDDKICICGNILRRSDYPKLTDANWNSKKYCSKQCARKARKLN